LCLSIKANPVKNGGAKPPVYGILSYDSGASEMQINSRNITIRHFLLWPGGCAFSPDETTRHKASQLCSRHAQ
jgi:hypothetical protein